RRQTTDVLSIHHTATTAIDTLSLHDALPIFLANGGKQVQPTLIDRIQDRWGHAIWRHDKRECKDCKAQKWEGQPEPDGVAPAVLDRKSTRLNSSHVASSYAVFCLKKKTTFKG